MFFQVKWLDADGIVIEEKEIQSQNLNLVLLEARLELRRRAYLSKTASQVHITLLDDPGAALADL